MKLISYLKQETKHVYFHMPILQVIHSHTCCTSNPKTLNFKPADDSKMLWCATQAIHAIYAQNDTVTMILLIRIYF